MANQSVSTSANHDDLTGRAAGEDFTISGGAVLTIDSMPHLTPMGILGDVTINDGEIHIDGTRSFEVAYSGGSGTLPSVGAAITWNSGADNGKIIRLNSGDNASGVLTITKTVGAVTPDDADIITDGSWTADIDSVSVGFLIIYGEDQDYGALDARATVRITGDWYQIGVGTGADGQTFTLPHTGHQHGIYVETGSGTNVFEWWHRISSQASTIFYDSFAEFGSHFEGGKVFQQTFGSSTLTIGTSTNGGVIPSGARVRIPNVHMGTTTVGAPTTEVNSTVFASHVAIIPPAVTCNVFIDHLNASSVAVNFSQTNQTEISDSCIGLSSTFIDRCASPVFIDNCCWCCPSVNNTGGIAASCIYTVLDALNGITITDSVFYGGIDTAAGQSLWIQTSANITFEGINKIALAITDENTSVSLRLTASSNIVNNGELILLGAGVLATAASNSFDMGTFVFGLPIGRGTTEQNITAISATSVDSWSMPEYRNGVGTKVGTLGLFSFIDSSNITLRNAGSPTSKVDLGARATYVTSFTGVCSNILMQRLYFTNLNGTETFLGVNSVKGVRIENCSTDYADEMEADCNDMIIKGVHVASGSVDSATGFEGDMSNVVGTVFYDHFKSDTTGALGLLFNAPGTKHASDFQITSGTPIFNGLADLLMRTSGDQVVYTYPYSIKGHTAFQNAAIQVSAVGSYNYEYDIDTGSGFSGSWTTINGANLSAETISPAGFGFKIRITATATNSSAAIKGLAVLTDTTLADQAANYYPLSIAVISLSGLVANSRVQIYDITNDVELYNSIVTGTSLSFESEYISNYTVRVRVMYATSSTARIFEEFSDTVTVNGLSRTIVPVVDSVYVSNAIDGFSVTGITIDDAALLLEAEDGTYTWQEIYAYETAWLYSEEGIRDEGRFITAIDTANYLIENFMIKNVSDPTAPLIITGGWGRDSVTNQTIDIIDTTGGAIFSNPDQVISYATGSGLSPSEQATLSKLDTLTEDVGGLRFTAQALEEAPAGGGGATAADIADAVWDEVLSGHLTAGTTGAALNGASAPSAATVATAVRSELTTELGRIDVATSTRLSTAGYTVPPTVGAIRTELDTNSTKLDVAVGTRLATAGYTTPPTVAAIRSEIDTNSTKLDVTVGSRLSSAGYTAPANSDIAAIKAKTDNLPSDPADESSIQAAIAAIPSAPSAASVASQVRTELTTELARIDVAVSTRNAVEPDNAGVAAIDDKLDLIKQNTDLIPATV